MGGGGGLIKDLKTEANSLSRVAAPRGTALGIPTGIGGRIPPSHENCLRCSVV